MLILALVARATPPAAPPVRWAALGLILVSLYLLPGVLYLLPDVGGHLAPFRNSGPARRSGLGAVALPASPAMTRRVRFTTQACLAGVALGSLLTGAQPPHGTRPGGGTASRY